MPDHALLSTIVVTSADAERFDLALELIGSVRQFSTLDSIRLGMLDSGLTEAQRGLLADQDVAVAPAEWKFPGELPTGVSRGYLAMLARPFLPESFPGFDTIVSLDSDTWVQMPRGVTDLVAAAAKVDVAAAPEIHPSYGHLYNPNNLVRETHRNTFNLAFGKGIPNPADNVVLNAGVFAARRESRLWKAWAQSLNEALARVCKPDPLTGASPFSTNHFIRHFVEQNAFNHACYHRGLRLHPVSALYNFICTLSRPVFDPEIKMLVEPSWPYAPINIVHLTGAGREAKIVGDRNGQVLQKGLHWHDWRDMLAG